MKIMTTAKFKNKVLWPAFSIFIRTRDCLRTTGCASFGLCFTCDKRYHFKLLQAGHYIPGRHNNNLFEETGCHAQCYNCNINLKGNTHVYAKKLIELYGEDKPEWLYQNDQVLRKFTLLELKEKLEYYKNKVRGMENG